MSGVIIDDVQWERCNHCSRFVRMSNLGYEKPSPQRPHGRDLCVTCVDHLIHALYLRFDHVRPAVSWVAAYT